MTPIAKMKKALPEGHEIPEAVLDRMGFLLNRAAQKLREATERALESYGLTGKHLGILLFIREKGALPQQEIGKCIHVDRTTMVNLIDELEKKGLVERKSHPTDRRAHAIYLTSYGKEILPKAVQRGKSAERKFLSFLPAGDRMELGRILKHLVLSHHLREANKEK